MNWTPEQQKALRTARLLLEMGHPLEVVIINDLIARDQREFVEEQLRREENIVLTPARTLVDDRTRADWLSECDRSTWWYWPALRDYLAAIKGWDAPAIRSLDDNSDSVVGQLPNPKGTGDFDTRGLVLGFVQSGKTANYTAVIAKATDAGYRLVIVLAGVDNGLRRQTQHRLKRELVGYSDNRPGAVHLPPIGMQWHEFTRDELNGDFQPGFANHAALQGSQPVLLVVKKNGAVLRKLIRWLEHAPPEVRETLPMLVIDDEADQASVDTRGTYHAEDDDPDPDYEPPSIINSLIRNVLTTFKRRAYVAYTATPFANVLIPHDAFDPRVGNDLYPKNFIIDLPKPRAYFGAEEFFGRMDAATGDAVEGLDVVRDVDDADVANVENGILPVSLGSALQDFVLAGAARAQRGDGDAPATMLVHTSQLTDNQAHIRSQVADLFAEVRDAWRYQRRKGIEAELHQRWEQDFRPGIRIRHPEMDVPFDRVQDHVGPFLEAIQVREVNSRAGHVLDYDREPDLKAIAVGGNKLSRGLTLEGLLVSFFVRRSATYDTLMQMGRWFGFRAGYEDLTRIYTTAELWGWFRDLAQVEYRLREDIQVYEAHGLTPREVGVRIWLHPAMQVTSPLKRRFASDTYIAQSYGGALEQTFKFPLQRLDDLATQADANKTAVQELVGRLGAHDPGATDDSGPVWTGVGPEFVLSFLNAYQVDPEARSLSIPLIRAYIQQLNELGELTRWVVAVRGRETEGEELGRADWGLPGGPIPQISRSRLGKGDSVGVITSPADEGVALPLNSSGARLLGVDARSARPPEEGVLLLYPISRASGKNLRPPGNRRPLYDDLRDPRVRDLVGLAISFPSSKRPQRVEAYLTGTVGWRPVE